jgi:AcrR family transcriptional regulator
MSLELGSAVAQPIVLVYRQIVPKLSARVRDERRRHIEISAWRCFSRNGFHATSMDDVIAETGMSSSAVYRYFRSKDDLIAAAADEALARMRDALANLSEQDPPPSPKEVTNALVAALDRQTSAAEYDMSRITIQAWGEALRRPELRRRSVDFYAEVRAQLTSLAKAWQSNGRQLSNADAKAAASVLFALMPGLIIAHHLSEPLTARELLAGIDVLANVVAPTEPPPASRTRR